MHRDPDPFAFFVACARKANAQGWVPEPRHFRDTTI
jgi:hypothetical protein